MATKTYYFGRIPKHVIAAVDSEVDPPHFIKGKSRYYFRMLVNFDDQDVMLEDSLGRRLPIDFESLPELVTTLDKLDHVHSALDKFYKEK